MKKRFAQLSLLMTSSSVSFSSSVPFSSNTATRASFQAGTYYNDVANDDMHLTAREVKFDENSTVHVTSNDDDSLPEAGSFHCVAVGIIDLSDTESKILLRKRLHDGSEADEWWGLKKVTTILENDAANNILMSSVIGISCDGLVLNLTETTIDFISCDSTNAVDGCLEVLDDVLLSLADSLIHRFPKDFVMQVIITFQGSEKCNDVKIRKTKDYIQKYLERALSKLLGSKIYELSSKNCDFAVKISPDTATDVATQTASLLLSSNGYSSQWHLQQLQVIREELKVIDSETIKLLKKADDIPMTCSTDFRYKVEASMAAVISAAEDDLDFLESKIDNALLESGGSNVPMPEFGSDANALLSKVSEAYLKIISEAATLAEADRKWVESKRIETIKHLAGVSLYRLHRFHLQNLRDHFGRTYEEVLDKTSVIYTEEMGGDAHAKDRDLQRKVGAKKTEEDFLNAAFSSIPDICRDPLLELDDLYSCIDVLRGLVEDMHEATLSRGIEEEEWNDVIDMSTEEIFRLYHDVNSHTSSKTRVGIRDLIKIIKNNWLNRGPAKWYERLAAKALVIGVNYAQGWLVLQTLRREARRRDLTMPKFPLF